MENLYEIIGKLLAAAFVALLAYLTPKVKEWLEARTVIVTTVEKRYTRHRQRKRQRKEFYIKSVSTKPRIFQWG